jgi:hypothetical protein
MPIRLAEARALSAVRLSVLNEPSIVLEATQRTLQAAKMRQVDGLGHPLCSHVQLTRAGPESKCSDSHPVNGLLDWHPKRKPGLFSVGVHVDVATMRLGDLGGDVEAKTETFGIVPHLAAMECLEQVLHHFFRDRLARVGNAQL